MPADAPTAYRFEAIATDGTVVRGRLDAADEAAARAQLRALAITPRLFEPVVPTRTAPLGADDLLAFNEQLAHLARAGLPVEHGLRLVAQDLSRGRLRDAVAAVVADLERGASLSEAIARQRRAFPPLYADVVEAGIRANNLPAVLFGLGRHVELTQRLRASLGRALAYPAVLLVALVVVAAFLSAYVLPQLAALFTGRHNGFELLDSLALWNTRRGGSPPTGVPVVLLSALLFGRIAPWIASAVVAAVLAISVAWPTLRGTRLGASIRDGLLLRLPLIGRPLRSDLVGRWCDVVRIGVESGLDLPRALSLAAQAIGSPRLAADTALLADAHAAGQPLDAVSGRLALLPPVVPATLELGITSGQLPSALATLSDLYARQAESRARAIPLVLSPLLIALIAVTIGWLLTAMFVPIIRFFNALG